MQYVFLVFIIISSCTLINKSSREHYEFRQKLRHGIVPVPSEEKSSIAKKLDSSKLTLGKKLYKAHCINCHGESAQGDGPKATSMTPLPRDLTKIAKEVPNFKFFMQVSKWQGSMPGWKKQFTPEEIESLEQYIHSLNK